MGDIKQREAVKITGTVRVYSHPAGTKFDKATAKLEVEQKNLIMDSPNYGIDLLIQSLLPDPSYPATLSFIEIGTGNTTPAVTDTALTAPTNRAAITFYQDYGATDAIVQTIFSDSQLSNGTYYEMGTFAGGTSTIGSGQMFNHALFGTAYTKISGQDTTVQADFSFS